jgi:hypothetical protein
MGWHPAGSQVAELGAAKKKIKSWTTTSPRRHDGWKKRILFINKE